MTLKADDLAALLSDRLPAPALRPSEQRMETLTVTPVPAHLTSTLAPPPANSAAVSMAPIVLEGLEKAHSESIAKVDKLIAELTRLKDALNDNHEGVKAQLARHFALAAEAHGFTDRVRARLEEISHGGDDDAE